MTELDDALAADARLIILRELARQLDARLNEVALARVLDVHGIKRTQAWLRTQLNALAELGAIRVEDLGTVKVATLRAAGRAHVDRRALLDSVAAPGDEA